MLLNSAGQRRPPVHSVHLPQLGHRARIAFRRQLLKRFPPLIVYAFHGHLLSVAYSSASAVSSHPGLASAISRRVNRLHSLTRVCTARYISVRDK
jgi:hypothetical protein